MEEIASFSVEILLHLMSQNPQKDQLYSPSHLPQIHQSTIQIFEKPYLHYILSGLSHVLPNHDLFLTFGKFLHSFSTGTCSSVIRILPYTITPSEHDSSSLIMAFLFQEIGGEFFGVNKDCGVTIVCVDVDNLTTTKKGSGLGKEQEDKDFVCCVFFQ